MITTVLMGALLFHHGSYREPSVKLRLLQVPVKSQPYSRVYLQYRIATKKDKFGGRLLLDPVTYGMVLAGYRWDTSTRRLVVVAYSEDTDVFKAKVAFISRHRAAVKQNLDSPGSFSLRVVNGKTLIEEKIPKDRALWRGIPVGKEGYRARGDDVIRRFFVNFSKESLIVDLRK